MIEGIPCEVAKQASEMTVVMFHGWVHFKDFTIRESENTGWVVYESSKEQENEST